MRSDASVPKALYQANIDLALRIAALLQESGSQWFDLFAAEANVRLEESVGQSHRGKPVLSPEQALKWMQSNPIRWQALLTQAAGNQTRFAEGLQAALLQWRTACADAFESAATQVLPEAAGGLDALPGWQTLTDSMQEFMAHFLPKAEVVATASMRTRPQPAAKTSAASASKPTSKAAKKTPSAAPRKKASTKPKAAAAKAAAPKTQAASARLPARKPVKADTDKKPRPVPASVTRSRRTRPTES